MEKHKAVNFRSSTGLEPLKKHKATNIGFMLLPTCLCFLRDTGCGIAVSEIFGVIREDSRCCV